MSFILEALKKAEKLRKAGEVPTAISEQPCVTPKRSLPFFRLLLITILILNLSTLVFWLSRNGEETQPAPIMVREFSAQKTFEPIENTVASADNRSTRLKGTEEVGKRLDTQRPSQVLKTSPPTSGDGQSQVISHVYPETGNLQKLEDLPMDVRQRLPNLTMSAHVYSAENESRLVNIAGTTLHEGDKVAQDLILEEITEKGAVFNFKGYFFSVSIF